MDIRGKKFVLLGGAGLIGSHTLDMLVKEDVKEIIIYDNMARGSISNIQENLKDPRVKIFEAGGDWQLSKFLSNPENKQRVMDQGFWRYTRHPNYFGDCCIWWAFGIIGLLGGAPWWSFGGTLLMTFLLLRVSGVTMLEKTIATRRPDYVKYIERTSTFFPLPPKPN